MDLEKRKQENQKERLRQNERAKRLKEQETAIKLDKRLSDAEKIRKIKLLQDGESCETKLQFFYQFIHFSRKCTTPKSSDAKKL